MTRGAWRVFSIPNNYPRRWVDMSPDFQAFMASHGVVMILFLIGGALTVPIELAVEGALLSILAAIAIFVRLRQGWRWPGCGLKDILIAVGTTVLTVIFGGASHWSFPITDPRFLPWYLGVANIGLFNVLNALHVLSLSRSEFLANRPGEAQPDLPVDTEPVWKKAARLLFQVVFLGVWLAGVGFFYAFDAGMHHGAPAPTAFQTEPLTNHGQVVYVSASEAALVNGLEAVMFISMPAVLIAGFFLQLVLKVRVFGNVRVFGKVRT